MNVIIVIVVTPPFFFVIGSFVPPGACFRGKSNLRKQGKSSLFLKER